MFRHIKKLYSTVSDRVKSVEYHPTEPILAIALYNGTIQIFNTNDMSILKTIRVEANKPVRCVRFMPSFHWLIAAGDNLTIYCYDYNTGALVTSIPEAHNDFIRQIAVHPTQPLFLSCSDDSRIKLFRINKNNEISLERTFEGHDHFVMDVKINPKDPSTFATASLDQKINFWGLTTSTRRFTLSGHKGGVNCIEFFPGNDRPFIASGSDDYTIIIWDYQTKSCVVTLSGHRENVTALHFHPTFPLLFSTAEDNMFLVWNTLTHETETALDYQKKRGWAIDVKDNLVAVGYDEGLVVLKIGGDPSVIITMDSNGQTFWAKNNEIQSSQLSKSTYPGEGQIVDMTVKDVSTSEIYPSSIQFGKSRYVALCGENEYSIYSSLAWRAKSFGPGKQFVWSNSDCYAVLLASGKVEIHYDFSSNPTELETSFDVSKIFGGTLIGISSYDSITFYTWNSSGDTNPQLVRQIDVKPNGVWWSQNDTFVSIATSDSLYILQYDENFSTASDYDPQVGSETSFTMISESDFKVKKGFWYNDVFFFNDHTNTVYMMTTSGQAEVIAHTDKNMTLVGYVAKTERIFLCDKDYNFVSYSIPLSIIDFIANVTNIAEIRNAHLEEEEGANDSEIDLSDVPEEWKPKMCTLLESLRLYKEAMELCDNDDKKFVLAMKLSDTKTAVEIARKTNSYSQYAHLSAVAMKSGEFGLLRECLIKSGNDAGLLLLASCEGKRQQMNELLISQDSDSNANSKQNSNADLESSSNVTFAAAFACGNYERCIKLLIEKRRYPEASLMARTYCPKMLEECATKWKELLIEKGETRTAQTIALPSEYPEKFQQYFDSAPAQPQIESLNESKKENENAASLFVEPQNNNQSTDNLDEINTTPNIDHDVDDIVPTELNQDSPKLEDNLIDDLLNDTIDQTEPKANKSESVDKKPDDNNDDDLGSDIENFLDEMDNL
ncbi:hypothetical protein M9Y10_028959 [Tritrichomonas musculus]|uniref:Coatomer subunit beta' n=1 Tax=Tritrichomonas musculus TaxID=1915356 RepID=A0ABR2KKU7_9EUKA